jgi:hydroxymethylglutaryl-CoA lyase
LLAIVANLRGVEEACSHPKIHTLGYPFSISETFQLRNTNRKVTDSLSLVKEMAGLAQAAEKELVVYVSMAFGNPYGDAWSQEIALEWAEKIAGLGIRTLALADTTGLAEREDIAAIFSLAKQRMPEITFGAHFHSRPESRRSKLAAAWEAGCRRFDVAIQGFGGCPFAQDELVGNVSTESLLVYLESIGAAPDYRADALEAAQNIARTIFLPA